MATKTSTSDAELMRLPQDGRKYELVDGEVRVTPAGGRHGRVIVRLTVRVGSFVEKTGLGEVFDSSTGFRMPGGNVRSPDLSFVSAAKLTGEQVPEGFVESVPELAVEVLSPEDSERAVLDKVGEYLAAGVRLVWVLDPKRRRAAVHRSLTEVKELGAEDSLDGEDVIPGFSCRLSELLV